MPADRGWRAAFPARRARTESRESCQPFRQVVWLEAVGRSPDPRQICRGVERHFWVGDASSLPRSPPRADPPQGTRLVHLLERKTLGESDRTTCIRRIPVRLDTVREGFRHRCASHHHLHLVSDSYILQRLDY